MMSRFMIHQDSNAEYTARRICHREYTAPNTLRPSIPIPILDIGEDKLISSLLVTDSDVYPS